MVDKESKGPDSGKHNRGPESTPLDPVSETVKRASVKTVTAVDEETVTG